MTKPPKKPRGRPCKDKNTIQPIGNIAPEKLAWIVGNTPLSKAKAHEEKQKQNNA